MGIQDHKKKYYYIIIWWKHKKLKYKVDFINDFSNTVLHSYILTEPSCKIQLASQMECKSTSLSPNYNNLGIQNHRCKKVMV
jgi:hypothetical protein